MTQASQVRALSRGLDILEFLAEHGPASLHQIHVGVRLPKTSLRRLLATLVERRFVRVGLSDGMYRSNIATLRAVDPQDSVRVGRLVEVAHPHMLDLTRALKWPVHLHVFANARMRIIESTHGQSAFGASSGADVEVELNMFVSASGLAYLAQLPDARVLEIMEQRRDDPFASPARYGIKADDLLANLAAVRAAGYGTRKTSQLRPDKRHAIAVAICEKGSPLGAFAVAWPMGLMTPDAFAKAHLETLSAAARAVSAALGA